MLPSDTNHTPPSGPPTGDLEHLFRQKFAEAEVPPSAGLWAQLDHNLVVGQNETYRRRLALYRWVAAASVLLLVGFGSWFGLRYGSTSGRLPEFATLAAPATDAPSATGSGSPAGAAGRLALGPQAGATRADAGSAAELNSALYDIPAAAAEAYVVPMDRAEGPAVAVQLPFGFTEQGSSLLPDNGRRGADGPLAAAGYARTPSAALGKTAGGSGPVTAVFAALLGASGTAAAGQLPGELPGLTARMAALPRGLGYGRPALLPLTTMRSMLADLASATSQEEKKEEGVGRPRRWRLLGSYAASAYNPNIDFSPAGRSPVVASRGFFLNSASTYAMAAAEYRQHLRAGLGQRVALTASYTVNKHWTLQTGLEVAQQRASSRTSHGFLDGRQVVADVSTPNVDPDLLPAPVAVAHPTYYRYRTAGLPVGVRYGSTKSGISVYAKAGAVVSMLLNSRSELEGTPEATRVYTMKSIASPYRPVQASGRVGAGVRFQPANATWSLAVGPTAEAGLTPLNADSGQGLQYRSRPYSVGMEASVEFGGKPVLAP
ncbi:hypothetical protein GCM10022408_29690 [Hymenobacter fastidiosus]|uniref:Outer membrane protein beta-barrel domain-containing protein n=1 Tax=Hymenobacter fastidiosus TaxID=486264 RepID=A0ABP7SP83_9BACT